MFPRLRCRAEARLVIRAAICHRFLLRIKVANAYLKTPAMGNAPSEDDSGAYTDTEEFGVCAYTAHEKLKSLWREPEVTGYSKTGYVVGTLRSRVFQENHQELYLRDFQSLSGHKRWVSNNITRAFLLMLENEARRSHFHIYCPLGSNNGRALFFHLDVRTKHFNVDNHEYMHKHYASWLKHPSLTSSDRRRVELASEHKGMLVFTCHSGQHCTLAVVNFATRQCYFYDPNVAFEKEKNLDKRVRKSMLNFIAHILQVPNYAKWISGWTFHSQSEDFPRQKTGGDCEVLSAAYAEHIMKNKKMKFAESDMATMREHIGTRILCALDAQDREANTDDDPGTDVDV